MKDNKFFENYKKREQLYNTEEEKSPQTSSAASISKKPNINVRPIYYAIGLAAIIIIAILTFSLASGVKAEDLTGWAYSDAELWAEQNGVNLRAESVFDDEIAENTVISMDDKSSKKIKKGSFVSIKVSRGHDLSVKVDLPKWENMSASDISKWAETNFMSKVRITTEKNSLREPGSILKFEVNDATLFDPLKVRRDSPIYVVVATMQEIRESVMMEDFVGKQQTEAGAFTALHGLELKINEEYNEVVPYGQVVSQKILAGETVFKGDKLEISISKGKKIIIPDFSKLTKEQAQAKAASIGVTPIIKDVYSTKKITSFVSQSIKAGAVLEKDDALEIDYSLGSQVTVPTFIGQSLSDIDTWMQPLNQQGAKLSVSSSTTKSSQAKGTVIYQDIRNMKVSFETAITVVVSSGNVVFVPQFTSSSHNSYSNVILREEAMKMCEAASLVPVFIAEENTNVLPGEIWSQSEPAAKEISEGSKITLKYRPVNQSYSVPNFIGMTSSQVKNGSYGAYLTIRFDGADADSSGLIISQSIKASSKTAMGAAIVLTVGAPASSSQQTPISNETQSTGAVNETIDSNGQVVN